MIPIQSLLFISAVKKYFRAIFDNSAIYDDELTLKFGDIVEFLGEDEDEGWYKGQLRGKTGFFPSNYVEALPPSCVPSSTPTPDGKQLHSASISEIYPDRPLQPTPREGGAAASFHKDPTPPTSAGEFD